MNHTIEESGPGLVKKKKKIKLPISSLYISDVTQVTQRCILNIYTNVPVAGETVRVWLE
jgi:hypothetical protein